MNNKLTAASLTFGLNNLDDDEEKRVIVLDLGGGSLYFTLL